MPVPSFDGLQSAALVAAGLLSVLLFPAGGLAILGRGAEVPTRPQPPADGEPESIMAM
jgi:hypothetical protein